MDAEAELANAEALLLAGRAVEAERLATGAWQAAEASDNATLSARAAWTRAEAAAEQLRPSEAHAVLADALTGARERLPPGDIDLSLLIAGLAWTSWQLGLYDESLALLREAEGALPESAAPSNPLRASALFKCVGDLAQCRKEIRSAESSYRKALDCLEAAARSDSLQAASLHARLARLKQGQGRLEEARRHLQSALDRRRAHLGGEHRYIAYLLQQLAVVEIGAKRPGPARRRITQALSMLERCAGPDDPVRASMLMTSGTLAMMMGRSAEATRLMEEAHAIEARRVNSDIPSRSLALSLAWIYLATGRADRAEPVLRQLVKEVALARRAERDEFPTAFSQLVMLLRKGRRHAEIVALAQEMEVYLRENSAAPADWIICLWNAASEAHLRLGRPETAHQLLMRAIDEGERLLSPSCPVLAPLFSNLAEVLEALGRPEEAIRARERHGVLRLQRN